MFSRLLSVSSLLLLTSALCCPALAGPFEDALTQAYQNNPALQAQREALKAKDEGVSQAVSGFFPSAQADYDKGRRRIRGTGDWNYSNPETRELSVVQPIFNGGETLAEYKSARARVKAGRAELRGLEQQVLLDAVNAYTDIVEKAAVLELSRANRQVLDKERESAQARFDAGDVTRTDVAQAEARLSTAEAQAKQAEGNLATARATYLRIIGSEPAAIDALPPLPEGLPATLDEATSQAPANPVVTAALFTEKAAASDVNARISTLLPVVSLQGSVADTRGSRFAGGGGTEREDAVTMNVTIPLYQSGAEYSRIREAKNVREQAKFQSLDTHQAAVQTATTAWNDYTTAKAVSVSNEEAVKAAEVALEGVREENRYGTRTTLDVLDAEQELFNAKVNLVTSQRSEKLQAYRLLGAVGRLNPEVLKLQIPSYDPEEHYDDVKFQRIGF